MKFERPWKRFSIANNEAFSVAVNVGKSLLKAKSLIKKGDVDTAAQLYKLILASYPQNRQAINGLASLAQAGSTRTQSGGQPSREQIENLLRLYNAGNLQLVLERGEILATQYPDDRSARQPRSNSAWKNFAKMSSWVLLPAITACTEPATNIGFGGYKLSGKTRPVGRLSSMSSR